MNPAGSVLLCSLSLFQPGPVAAQAFHRLDGQVLTAAEVDRLAARAMAAARVPGLGLALIEGGRVVYLKAYGWRDLDRQLPLTPDSVMAAASLSKAAFAYAVMQMVDERVLELDCPIMDYLPRPLPAYPRYADLAGDLRWERITPRMLLAHTSGLPNWRHYMDGGRLAIYFEPGTRFAYSGEGMDLLQLVVETVEGRPLEEVMARRVFRPLGMTRSSMVWEARFETDAAQGHNNAGKGLGPQRRRRAGAAGSLQTTLADYARFLEAVISGRGLSVEAREAMLSPQVRIRSAHEFPTLDPTTTTANEGIRLGYGLGWGLYQTPWGRAFFKEGHDDGVRHYVVCLDGPGKGLLIMTDGERGEDLYSELLEDLLGNTLTPLEWEGFKARKR